MEIVISAIAFILIFSLIILVHEFGHFYVARKMGVKVEEFGIGLPPRIWGKKIKGTIYSFNWIPFGGFVRLYGEDVTDPKLRKDKQSYASKPIRKRMAIIIAGVVMNFLLAIVLLTIGFVGGIDPLIVTSDDFFSAVESGIIELDQGVRIENVEEGSIAAQAGLQLNDVINRINGERIISIDQLSVLTEPSSSQKITLEVVRNGSVQDITLNIEEEVDIGIDLYNIMFLSRVFIHNVLEGSSSQVAGLQPGDVILAMNGQPVYFISEYQNIVNRENIVEYTISRDFQTMTIPVEFAAQNRLLITEVLPDGSALDAGLQKGDIILEIEANTVQNRDQAVEITKANPKKELAYKVERNGEVLDLNVTPNKDGLIGVFLESLVRFENNQLGVYNSSYLTSVIKTHEVQYPFPQAIGEAFNESGKLALITIDAFGNLIRSVISQFTVPAGVAGPVGIYKITSVLVQDGLLALLRFTALLSLSLAVLNIIPFPALDGGRLLFLLVEAVVGRRIPHRWESFIHALGFVILIGLIILVTFSDLVNPII